MAFLVDVSECDCPAPVGGKEAEDTEAAEGEKNKVSVPFAVYVLGSL